MSTHGHITVAPFIHGTGRDNEQFPGYRSEFMTSVDIFKWKRVYFGSLLGNTTIITHEGDDLNMDRIRYNLTPFFRLESKSLIVRGGLNHEGIHILSRHNDAGSIFWNSLQIGFGSRGAYYIYLKDFYAQFTNEIVNHWDAQINFGYIIPAEATLLTGQNHDYNYEMFTVFRYQFAVVKNWAIFATLRQHSWLKTDGESFEHKIEFTLNFFRKGTVGFAGIFYNYTAYDTYSIDNKEGLGALGLRILF